MYKFTQRVLFILVLGLSTTVMGDDLVRMAQQDLATLGYDPGTTSGEATTQTVIAISKFQAEHDMTVDGEATPQLVGALRAAIKQQNQSGATVSTTARQTATAQPPSGLQKRQQACLQEKVAANRKKHKTKRAFMKLLSAVSRSSRQFGDGDTARTISKASSQAYSANATYGDLQGAAEDLGLTDDEMEECRNPQQSRGETSNEIK